MTLNEQQIELLLLSTSGELNEEQESKVARLMNSNPEASEYLESLKQTQELVNHLEAEPPAGSPLESAMSRIDNADTVERSGREKRSNIRVGSWVTIAAVVALVAAVIGLRALLDSGQSSVTENNGNDSTSIAKTQVMNNCMDRFVRNQDKTTRSRIRNARQKLESFKQPNKRMGVFQDES